MKKKRSEKFGGIKNAIKQARTVKMLRRLISKSNYFRAINHVTNANLREIIIQRSWSVLNACEKLNGDLKLTLVGV